MSTHHRPAGTGATTDGGPSPYLIGAAIGLLNIFAFAAFRKGIGVSGAYESSAALVARRLMPRMSTTMSGPARSRPSSTRSPG